MDGRRPGVHRRRLRRGTADPSGRVTGLVIDPSDPSGNTVFAGGASGGIWKTTDFLTTEPSGPTWIPLTDFGPTSGVNTGGIAIFPRNNDPNQSIVIVATGEGDTGTPGVGLLDLAEWRCHLGPRRQYQQRRCERQRPADRIKQSRSELRGRRGILRSSSTPRPLLDGQVIIYAALSGPTGGIWRSLRTRARPGS